MPVVDPTTDELVAEINARLDDMRKTKSPEERDKLGDHVQRLQLRLARMLRISVSRLPGR